MPFIAELKRRNVFRVAAAYLVAGWLIVEVGSVLVDIFGAPGWVLKLLVGILGVGFPVALLFSWVYELTPEGVKRDKDVVREDATTRITARRLDKITIGLIVLAVAFVLLDRLWLRTTDSDGARATTPPNSIAVLAFADMSPDKDQEHFSDGLSDTLIHVLAQVSGLRVTAKTSSFYFKGKDVTIAEIAEKLDVAHVLEGSVQKSGNQVRVIAQLVKASDGSHVWSRNFDRDLEDIFAVQDEIAREVVAALKISLVATEQERLGERYQPSLGAYEQLIRGGQLMATRTISGLTEAEIHLRRAIEMDPSYGLAFALLAQTLALQYEYFALETSALDSPQGFARQAIELAPELAESHAANGLIEQYRGDQQTAIEWLKTAIQLNPNYAEAHKWLGNSYILIGLPEAGLLQIKKGLSVDPLSDITRVNLSNTLFSLGRVEEALATNREGLRLNPDFAAYYGSTARILQALGRIGEAQRWNDEARKRNPEGIETWIQTCWGFLNLDDPLAAENCADRFAQIHPESDDLVRLNLHYHRQEWPAVRSTLEALLERNPGNEWFVVLLAAELTRQGELERARQLMADAFVTFLEDEVVLAPWELTPALHFAWILHASGDTGRRDVLLLAMEERMAAMHRTRGIGYGVTDMYIHLMRGDRDRAIEALREAVDMGWRDLWWFLPRDWRLTDLHHDPEFIARMNELQADIEKQRQWYEENKDKSLF